MALLRIIAAIAYCSLGLPDAVLGIAWPELRRDYGVPFEWLGLLLASTFTGYLISSSLASLLAKRMGIGWLLVASSATMTCVLTGYGLGSNFYVLLALGFLGGMGGGAIDASLNSYTAHRFSIRMVNWLHGCWGIGAFMGPLVMTWVVATERSWRDGYFVLAACLAVTTLLLFWTRDRWNLSDENSQNAEAPQASFWEVLSDRQVIGQCILFALYTGLESTIGQLFFTWWTEGRGLSAAVAGGAVTGYWFVFTAGRFGMGQVAHYFRGETIVLVAGTLFALLSLLLVFPPVSGLDLLVVVILGGVIAPIFPTWIGLTTETVRPERAAQAIGFQVSAAAIGIAFIPGVISFIASRSGLVSIPIAIALLSFIFAFLQWRLLRRVALGQRLKASNDIE